MPELLRPSAPARDRGRRSAARSSRSTTATPTCPGPTGRARSTPRLSGDCVRRPPPRQDHALRDRRGPPLGLHLGMAGPHRDRRPARPARLGPLHARVRGRRPPRPARPASAGPRAPRSRHAGPAPTPPRSPAPTFRPRIGRGRAPLKARMMDQSVIAGVGNLLADEILWHRPPLARAVRPTPSSRTSSTACAGPVRATLRNAIRGGGAHTGALHPCARRDGHCPRCRAALVRARSVGAPPSGAPTARSVGPTPTGAGQHQGELVEDHGSAYVRLR